jgi:hypothetical protein
MRCNRDTTNDDTVCLPCLASLAALEFAGCGKARPKANADLARETLRVALDAWKKGQLVDALQDLSPPIHVTDHEWREGFALLEYKISDKDQLFGPGLRCQVRLSLRNPRGKTVNKQATYTVGTNNALMIVREDDD